MLEKIILCLLKGLTGFVVGINIIERLLAPAFDELKRSIITKGAQAVPAIGGALSGGAGVLLSTAVVIKNSIGITGMIFSIILTIVPFFKLLFMILIYKLASAAVQPISDKRITGFLAGISTGGELLLKTLYTVSLLFLITIAVVASTTHV